MSLLEIYKEKNKNEAWFISHSSLSKNAAGRMFEYTNTNFRTQNSFIAQFKKFLEIENISREEWSRQVSHGQEVDKHRVINMIQSKLFKKDIGGLYSRTTKGLLYSRFIDSDSLDEDKWLINYLFLLNGYYLNRKNYIIDRVRGDLRGYLLSVDGITEDLLIQYAKELLVADSLGVLLREHFFFFHSFYDDSDFLISYLRAPAAEKEELARYIERNLETGNFVCCISKKYQPSGNFNQKMLVDETRVFLLTLLFIQAKDANLSSVGEIFVENFNRYINSLNSEAVLRYLRENWDVFSPIFVEILELEESEGAAVDIATGDNVVPIVESEDIAEDYIDETSEIGRQKIKAIYNIRKRQARIQSGYRCALETINNCNPIYFTAKASGENYLELHHFIPREFRNDFPNSIEVLANYVTLCPRCHRQIHLAVDRERKHLLNALYDERRDRLNIVGLGLELSGIYAYYKVDS